MQNDQFQASGFLKTSFSEYQYFRITKLEQDGFVDLDHLPFSLRVLLESLLRNCDGNRINAQDVLNLAKWQPQAKSRASISFKPSRVVMQDFTGVPAIVDLAAMRSALNRSGGDPSKISPVLPVDLVVDHSVQVDFFASPDALRRNSEIEFQRNFERYKFLKWGQNAFKNFRVVPPATGIVHQVNLEYLASLVVSKEVNGELNAYPDTLVGTDSHTTMINGLGVLGWGVGGIEAEAVILGQPIDLVIPDVVGFELVGNLKEGVTATDLTLTITQMLREKGVVEKFVEFFGSGLDYLLLPDRATISNMAPEYGATVSYFPVDDETLRYLRLTGRSEVQIELVEKYCKEQRLFRTANTPAPQFSETLWLDLNSIEPSVAGPKRPQDRIPVREVKEKFITILEAEIQNGGYGINESDLRKKSPLNGKDTEIGHGAVVIAAITSCTNTSNPMVMIAAGLLAKKAIESGLSVPAYIKTSLAPGSRVVTEYLEHAGLLEPLAKLGFNIVGYGCTTCIGNSGPLPIEVVRAITGENLVSVAVLSGNRNFEGRIHPYVRANFLASPPLVIAYALAGTVNINLLNEPLGNNKNTGEPVYLNDIWPSSKEIIEILNNSIKPALFLDKYSNVFSGNDTWNEIKVDGGEIFQWDEKSTYIQEPPFFDNINKIVPPVEDIFHARVIAVLGDSITTDHISPAGTFSPNSPAGRFLEERGVPQREFNTYGARRGNDRVMTRGTFANIRLKNLLVPGVEGGVTVHLPDGEQMTIFDAAQRYREEQVPLIVLAGKEYGTGSSRDWAAKGTLLLGIKAVIASSFERIHRSNLIGMGILPLEFKTGESFESLGLSGKEKYSIVGLSENIETGKEVLVQAENEDGGLIEFKVIVRLNTPLEVEYYKNGGILHTVLRSML